MKKLFVEISVVLALAVFIAIIYNLFSSKPLPWLAEKKDIQTIADSVIFGNTNDTDKTKIDTIKSNLTADTTAKINKNKDSLLALKNVEDKNLETTTESKTSELKSLTFKQVLKIINNPKFRLIDARPPHEWSEAHIGNAVNIYPFDENQEQYFKYVTAQPKDIILVVYCSGGTCEASHKVVNDLKSFGYKDVYLYSGGWDEWTKLKGE